MRFCCDWVWGLVGDRFAGGLPDVEVGIGGRAGLPRPGPDRESYAALGAVSRSRVKNARNRDGAVLRKR